MNRVTCCISGCQRRGRTVVELGETKLAFCLRCGEGVGAAFEWLRRLDELGYLTFGSSEAALKRKGEE